MALIAMIVCPVFGSAQAVRSNGKQAANAAVQEEAAGKEIFQQHCASCHFSETTAQKIGPGLKGLYTRLTYANGGKVTDGSLTKWIENGGKNMPGFKDTMKPEQLRALVSYIRTL